MSGDFNTGFDEDLEHLVDKLTTVNVGGIFVREPVFAVFLAVTETATVNCFLFAWASLGVTITRAITFVPCENIPWSTLPGTLRQRLRQLLSTPQLVCHNYQSITLILQHHSKL